MATPLTGFIAMSHVARCRGSRAFAALMFVAAACESSPPPARDSAATAVKHVVEEAISDTAPRLDVEAVQVREYSTSTGILVLVREPGVASAGTFPAKLVISVYDNSQAARAAYGELRRVERRPAPRARFFSLSGFRDSFCVRRRVEGAGCSALMEASLVTVSARGERATSRVAELLGLSLQLASRVDQTLMDD